MLKIDYNVVSKEKNIWIEQTNATLKIHSNEDIIVIDHEDVPALIKALEAYYDRYTAIQLCCLGSLNSQPPTTLNGSGL